MTFWIVATLLLRWLLVAFTVMVGYLATTELDDAFTIADTPTPVAWYTRIIVFLAAPAIVLLVLWTRKFPGDWSGISKELWVVIVRGRRPLTSDLMG